MASAHAQRIAAMQTADLLAQARADNTQVLDQGYGRARDDLTGNAGAAIDALGAWHVPAATALADAQVQGLSALGSGYDAARTSYGDAAAMYQPYADAGTKALGTYQDSLGLNGAAGNAAAVSSYQHSPGYEAAVNAATDAVARKQSALGVLGSGNTMQAISTKAQDLQNQDYGNWQTQLNGLSNTGLSALGQQANLTKGIGDLSAQQGNATANLDASYGAKMSGLDSAMGLSSAGIFTGLGSGLANVETGHANQIANTNMQAATGTASADMSAGQASDAAKNANENLMLGLGAGLLGMKTSGGGTVGGSIFSGLGKLFG